jgi:hypothetical protein
MGLSELKVWLVLFQLLPQYFSLRTNLAYNDTNLRAV